MVAVVNQDVLEAVCEALDNYADLRSFSLTCSPLRPTAVRCLLSLKPIILTETTVHAFHRFVFADPDARGQHIRGIVAGSSAGWRSNMTCTVDVATCFIEILERATHLKHLTLRNLGESYLGDTRIIPAMARLRTLMDLRMLKCDQRPSDDFLRASRSPIRTVRAPSSLSSPFETLANFSSTLQSIEFWEIPFEDFAVGPRFPAVHSLAVYNVWGTLRLNALLHMFPFLSTTLSFPFFSQPSVFHPLALREANKRAQDELGEHSWRRLDHVSGWPILLFVLNLQCPVRHLAVCCWQGLQPHFTSAALRNAHPQCLELFNVRLPEAIYELSDGLFPPEARATITHFLLVMEYKARPDSTSIPQGPSITLWKNVVDKLCSAITALNGLAHLRVIIECSIPSGARDVEDMFVRTLRHGGGTPYRHAAEEFAAAAPSLRNIIFTSSAREISSGQQGPVHCWRVENGWRVARHEGSTGGAADEAFAGGDWQVDALSGEETTSVLRREDLIDSSSRLSIYNMEREFCDDLFAA
ncbi:hypothetical protein LXA43DRAFT_883676 [Ganoderma leucocontextum]|nr:hypothetical protein LXA43DRAFT_883676 [Ganoderma leucocontextum]